MFIPSHVSNIFIFVYFSKTWNLSLCIIKKEEEEEFQDLELKASDQTWFKKIK